MSPGNAGIDAASADGRHLRAQRNRDLVVDAILDLFEEGIADIDAATLAERSGVSVRSVYRYFEDREALVLEGVARHGQRLAEQLVLDLDLSVPLAERLEGFLTFRIDRYRRLERLIEVTRYHAYRLPEVADTFAQRRAWVRTQLAEVFAPELADRAPGERHRLLASLDVATDFDSWRLLTAAHGMDDAEVRSTMTAMVHAVLGGAPGA